jgi:hypothetical protein
MNRLVLVYRGKRGAKGRSFPAIAPARARFGFLARLVVWLGKEDALKPCPRSPARPLRLLWPSRPPARARFRARVAALARWVFFWEEKELTPRPKVYRVSCRLRPGAFCPRRHCVDSPRGPRCGGEQLP